MTTRRLATAVVLSAVAHALAVWWLSKRDPRHEVPAASRAPVVQLTWFDAPPTPAGPRVDPAAHLDQPPRPPRAPPSAPARRVAPPAPAHAVSGAAKDQSAAVERALPRVSSLTPRVDVLGAPAPEAPHGTTLTPDMLPSERERVTAAGEAARAQVQTWASNDLVEARADIGIVSPGVASLRSAMGDALHTGHELDVSSAAKLRDAIVAGWAPGAARYGNTGSAYDTPAGYRRDGEMPTQLSRAVAAGSTQALEAQLMFERAARFRDFGAGLSGFELVAIARLAPGDGGPALTLLVSSGLAEYDAWVLTRGHEVVARTVADGGLPLRQSVWAFRGRITYMRAVTDIDPKKDWPTLALLMVSGLFTGRFDEMSGKAEYVDLTHPRFEAKPYVLREE